jgi:sugar lactone lactonase YvrE
MFKHFDGSLVAVALLLTACGGSGSPSPQPTERVALFAGMPGRDSSVSGGLVDGPAAGARFSLGLRLAVGPEGNLYVADVGNHAIRKITPQGVVSTLLVRNVPGEDLLGIAVDPAGVVHFSVTSCTFSSDHTIVLGCHGTVYRLSAALQAEPVIPLTSSDGSSMDLVQPLALAFDRAGNLYVSDSFTSCALLRLTPSGDLTTVASLCGSLAVSPDGALYVASGGAVWRIMNGAVSLVAGNPQGPPMNVDGSGPNARFAGVGGMAFDGRGNLYVADAGSMTVRKITPTAMVTTVAGIPTLELPGLGRFVPGPLPGELDHPGDVAIVGSDLYVTMLYSIAVVHDVP